MVADKEVCLVRYEFMMKKSSVLFQLNQANKNEEKKSEPQETTPVKVKESPRKSESTKKVDESKAETSNVPPELPIVSPQKSKSISTPIEMSEVSVVLEKMNDIETTVKEAIQQQKDQNTATVAAVISNKKRTRKRKSKRAADAPKFPLTGYVRFMNERRESLKQENPTMNHIDVTKSLAEEWLKLPENKKQPYMDLAEKDKSRYTEEMKEYNKVHGEKKKVKKSIPNGKPEVSNKPSEAKRESTNFINAPSVIRNETNTGTRDIQIFTEEFLEHNKQIESELKILRKSNTDYEQQNSNLERYVDNMKGGVQTLEHEHLLLQNKNEALQKYLTDLKTMLTSSLSNISMPENKGATSINIEAYMHELSNLSAPSAVLNKAKDVIRKLDFQSINI